MSRSADARSDVQVSKWSGAKMDLWRQTETESGFVLCVSVSVCAARVLKLKHRERF